MPEWVAILIGSGVVILGQFVTAAFIYGQLTQKVKDISGRTDDHQRRLGNAETVISGPGGHGERLTALEAWRIEHRSKQP